MGSWRKLLASMVADADPRSYSYHDAALILQHLGFEGPFGRGGSHRRFRRALADPSSPAGSTTIVIGLVDTGHGPMKPVYIKKMLATLREHPLLPVEEN